MQEANIQKVRWTRAAFGVDTADDGSPVIVRAERLGPSVRFQSVTADVARAECSRSGTRVATVMPVRDTVLRRIATPLVSRSKALRVLPSILDVQVPFPIEECEYRFYDLRLTEEGTFDALAVAARHSDLTRRIAALREAGLDPVALDHEVLALWTRSLKELPAGDAKEPRIVVSLHKSHAVAVIGQGRRILGGHHVRGTDPAAILRVLTPYRRTDMPGNARWCWTGPEATADRVASLFAVLQTAWPGTSTIHESPETFLARAVAAREVSTEDLACNLRDGPLVHPARRSRQVRRSTLAACVTLVCGVLMVAASLAAGWFGTKREADLTTAVGRLTDRLAGYHVTARGEHALKMARTAVEARAEVLQPFRRQLIDSPAAILPDILESAKRQGLQIETLTLTPRKLAVAGTARVWQSCDDLVMRLEKRGMKTRLERRDARDDLRIPFALTAEAPDG
jgi:hypothetical protein